MPRAASAQAIGQRNRLEAEEANCERQTRQLRQMIHERRSKLERSVPDGDPSLLARSYAGRPRRLDREQEALEKVEAQQEALLKKLANNEL